MDRHSTRIILLDLKIRNFRSKPDTFNTFKSVILSSENQYELAYGSTIESGEIFPGSIKAGYLLFKDVPFDINGDLRIIIGNSYSDAFNELIHELKITI